MDNGRWTVDDGLWWGDRVPSPQDGYFARGSFTRSGLDDEKIKAVGHEIPAAVFSVPGFRVRHACEPGAPFHKGPDQVIGHIVDLQRDPAVLRRAVADR